ncbi:MAG: dipeptidase [Anaerolineae bacterium]|nr:dipeptidase [Anaerolineae bacterium]MDQ7037338.1 dipeptidase [Anaerolineae bacterium]
MTKYPVFDGHNDTVLNLLRPDRGQGRTFFERSDIGHIDLPRAKEGGFAGGFFAMFVPNPPEEYDIMKLMREKNPDNIPLPPPLKLPFAQQQAFAMLRILFDIEKESDGQVTITRTVDELVTAIDNDILAMILHFEGAEPIDTNLDALEVFYQAGLRSIGLVWSRPNDFACGVPFKFNTTPDTGDGLTDAGKALVKACNELGIMLDLSHLNEKGFWDVAKYSDAPLVATHSNVHALCPTPRNLTDKQLDAVKESDGIVGLNFACGFLREDGKHDANTPIATMVKHIDYLVERIGIDRVALGSDFDGATIPSEIKDVAGLPKLIDALKSAGYGDEALQKITHQNWLRVLGKTWKD